MDPQDFNLPAHLFKSDEDVKQKIDVEDTDYHTTLKEDFYTDTVTEVDIKPTECLPVKCKKEEDACDDYKEDDIFPSGIAESLSTSVNYVACGEKISLSLSSKEINNEKVKGIDASRNFNDNNLSSTLITNLGIKTGDKHYKSINNICSVDFEQKHHVKTQQRIQNGEKPFKCEFCHFSTLYRSNLYIHQRLHTGEKPFRCDQCALTFSQKNGLKSHKIMHTGEKPFKCELCTLAYSQKHRLISHQRMHTGEKPFKCEICTLAFSQKDHLILHKIRHTGEKPFKCDLCALCYARKANLAAHLRVHTDGKQFICNLCSSAFSEKWGLLQHQKIHTGEKPFKCDQCASAYSQKGKLVAHKIKKHNGKKLERYTNSFFP